MKRHLEKKLKDLFPQLFRDIWGDPKVTCMAFGCDHGDGWYNILHDACRRIQRQLERHPEPEYKFTSVKNKLGRLLVYHEGTTNDEIHKIIDALEEDSTHVCERCGSEEGVVFVTGYISPVCAKCRGAKRVSLQTSV